ncbi:uncharacterized protein [Argopecten irradians]|uniref:uncharacterized protein n=1 Tax=Argopecten irradians TaxID=31199 RepID=UPI0037226064
MFAMQKTLTSSQDTDLKEDTVGTISLFQRGQAEVESCKALIQELEKSSRSTSLRHEYNPDILTLDTKTSLTLGTILVHQQQRKLPNTAALSERQLKMTRKINIKVPTDEKDCALYGVVLLSGGRIVVGDNANHKVKLFTENDDFLTVLSKIKIQNFTENCLGVTYNNNTFVVGTLTSLYSVPQNGGEATMLHNIESRCLHLASDQKNGRVFASILTSDPDAVAVTRLSDRTHTDVLKVGVVKGTAGIDVDREGNVYVCGGSSHNVIQMSGDGTNVRELLTSSDGIELPRAISVWGDKVVITSSASSEQRNFVHLFQFV